MVGDRAGAKRRVMDYHHRISLRRAHLGRLCEQSLRPIYLCCNLVLASYPFRARIEEGSAALCNLPKAFLMMLATLRQQLNSPPQRATRSCRTGWPTIASISMPSRIQFSCSVVSVTTGHLTAVPSELVLGQPLQAQHKARSVEEQELHPVTTAIAERKNR